MPNLPDIPGKSLIGGAANRTKAAVAGAGLGALAVGGFVLRKVIRRGGDDEGATSADPIAETPTSPPKPPKPKATKPKTEKPKATKPKPERPRKATSEPEPGDETEPPEERTIPVPRPESSPEPGNHSADKEPHHALNNPVGEPDETEWPDPYETRDDPRDPVDPDGRPFGEEPHPQTGSESTSEPPPSQDPEAPDPPR